MPAMLRKSDLKKIQKFKSFINSKGGDISNTLDNKIDTLKEKNIYSAPESDFFIVDGEKFKITEFEVNSVRDDGGGFGYITIVFYDENDEFDYEQPDSWIKYDESDKIVFDHHYSEPYYKIIKNYIIKGLEEAKIKMNSKKYNL